MMHTDDCIIHFDTHQNANASRVILSRRRWEARSPKKAGFSIVLNEVFRML
jgi:hypothetical protein